MGEFEKPAWFCTVDGCGYARYIDEPSEAYEALRHLQGEHNIGNIEYRAGPLPSNNSGGSE